MPSHCGLLTYNGLLQVIDAFHCGPYFWGYPSCCQECYDFIEVKENTQICYRGACNGLAGKNQVPLPSSQHSLACLLLLAAASSSLLLLICLYLLLLAPLSPPDLQKQ